MKAENQIRIGRITAIVMLFFNIIAPPVWAYANIHTADEAMSPKEAVIFLGIWYVFNLPLVLSLGGFAWALKRSKQKAAIILFILCVLWAILLSITKGIAALIFWAITIVLLLQGILGIRKMQMSIKTSDTNIVEA